MEIKIKYRLWKTKEIIYRIFLSLVHQFSLKLTGFSNYIDQQKQHQMYTLTTVNLFILCGSQNLGPHKGNDKSCLSDALIILWIQWLNEACVRDDSTFMIKRFNYFYSWRKLLHCVYCTILVYFGEHFVMMLH